MPDAKKKGWLLVAVQFILLSGILIFSYREIERFEIAGITSYTGFAIMIIGSLLALVSFFNFGQLMTPNPVPLQNYKLKTAGMYKYIRHPVYSSLLFALLGLVVYSKSVSGLIWWLLAVVFIIYKVEFEEKQLLHKFAEYAQYQKESKKLIPFIY